MIWMILEMSRINTIQCLTSDSYLTYGQLFGREAWEGGWACSQAALEHRSKEARGNPWMARSAKITALTPAAGPEPDPDGTRTSTSAFRGPAVVSNISTYLNTVLCQTYRAAHAPLIATTCSYTENCTENWSCSAVGQRYCYC